MTLSMYISLHLPNDFHSMSMVLVNINLSLAFSLLHKTVDFWVEIFCLYRREKVAVVLKVTTRGQKYATNPCLDHYDLIA